MHHNRLFEQWHDRFRLGRRAFKIQITRSWNPALPFVLHKADVEEGTLDSRLLTLRQNPGFHGSQRSRRASGLLQIRSGPFGPRWAPSESPLKEAL